MKYVRGCTVSLGKTGLIVHFFNAALKRGGIGVMTPSFSAALKKCGAFAMVTDGLNFNKNGKG